MKLFADDVWNAFVEACGNECVCCHFPLSMGGEIIGDHIVPRSKGGADTLNNLQPLCIACNSSKRSLVVDYRPDGWRQRFFQNVARL